MRKVVLGIERKALSSFAAARANRNSAEDQLVQAQGLAIVTLRVLGMGNTSARKHQHRSHAGCWFEYCTACPTHPHLTDGTDSHFV